MCTHPALIAAALALMASLGMPQQAHHLQGGRLLAVVSTDPAPHDSAPASATIAVRFNRPLNPASVNQSTFRVLGQTSGPTSGTFLFSDMGRRVTFVPNRTFEHGEIVRVNLAHSLSAFDGGKLRPEGYAFQFTTTPTPVAPSFNSYALLDNRTALRPDIYGIAAGDLDSDGYPDLVSVNENANSVHTFFNLGDGSGNYGSLVATEPLGKKTTKSELGDLNNDGFLDLCVAATLSDTLWIMLNVGGGLFSSTEVLVATFPRGIVTIDADGDADLDIINCNRNGFNLSLLTNDGQGNFASPVFFDGSVDGEFGLEAGDMNLDGILDLVVSGENGTHLRTLLGDGLGAYAPAGLVAHSTGGVAWDIGLGDLDQDGDLDTAVCNATNTTPGILKNLGDGTFSSLSVVNLGANSGSSTLGDIDGDGDLDWCLSTTGLGGGNGYWRLYRNNGAGSFSFFDDIPSPVSPSCSAFLDTDGDGDLDLALGDIGSDDIFLMRNH